MGELFVLPRGAGSRCEQCPLAAEVEDLEAEVREYRRALGEIQRWAGAGLHHLQTPGAG